MKVGDAAQVFSKQSHTGKVVDLATLRGRWVVLFFYPADNSPGCTAEACSFRDSYADFVAAGAEVIGVSADGLDSHRGFASKHQLPYQLISDDDGDLRRRYGVKKSLGLLPGRVTFVIDPDGVIRKVFSNQLLATKHVSEALSVMAG